jgi:hypothetical protein
MYSGVSLATHHIFFPPRFDAAIVQSVPQGNGGYALYFLVLDHLLLEQFKCPVVTPLWRRTAGKSDEMRLCFVVEL